MIEPPRFPALPRRAALVGLAYGVMVYGWLSLEDNGALAPALIGTGAISLIGLRWLLITLGGKDIRLSRAAWWIGGMLWGASLGAGSATGAALLMLLKNGLHGHAYPDYPFNVIAAMLARLPAWSAAGALIGLGGTLLMLNGYWKRRADDNS
ncbi:MAG: hypothetical protein U0670_15720 [Anaerolineae bacterium]